MAMTSMTGDGGSPSNQNQQQQKQRRRGGSSPDLLAPGFRFHPTDEELVSYYLKRKISGRRLRVDAIGEIDIYRVEPRDLPAMSKLRSRDTEWYFFSRLDRKYSNRTRTNRATSEGYWKTTGKDRPVHDRHRSLLVGMKKTLVFHAGRAPKGERTNWVMHEYRLHAHEPDNAQEGYVVCRIFQKTAPGPQNGAQYGAPFVEEEWVEEDDEEMLVPPPKLEEEEEEEAIGLTDNQFVQLDDFNCDEKEELFNQNEVNTLFLMDANGQNGETNSGNPADLFEDIFDVDNYINVPELQDDPNLMYNLRENSELCAECQKSPEQNDGYLELKDIFDNENMGYPPNESSFDFLEGIFNDQILANGVDEIPTFQEVDTDFFTGNGTGTVEPQQLDQMCLSVKGDLDLQLDDSQNPVVGDCHSGQQSEDNVAFYDSPNQDLPYPEDNFVDTSEMHFLPVSDFDMVDDLIAYFDATETNFPCIQDPSENREFNSYVAQPNLAPEVEQNSSATSKEVGAASTFSGLPEADKKFVNVEKDVNDVPGVQRKGSWNKSLTKHVVNMLGSISAPPAMAEDPGKQKTISLISASHASGSIHVSAGMVHVHGAVMESAEHWTLPKNGDIGFLLSYGMSGNDFEMNTKVQCGSMSMVLSCGFYLFGFSMLILAVSLKVGMCICNN